MCAAEFLIRLVFPAVHACRDAAEKRGVGSFETAHAVYRFLNYIFFICIKPPFAVGNAVAKPLPILQQKEVFLMLKLFFFPQ